MDEGRKPGRRPGLNKRDVFYQVYLTKAEKAAIQLHWDYLASPVELNTVVIYEIKDYGSAMAPYYIMLALFVADVVARDVVQGFQEAQQDG